MLRLATGTTVVLLAAGLSGCGLSDPYRHQPPSRSKTSPPRTVRSSSSSITRPTTPVVALLRRYTLLSIDWTSTTLAGHQRQLAALAVDGARDQALQTAASYATGTALQKSAVSNRGQITSIAPGVGPSVGEWVITTQETTHGRGDYQNLPPQPHVYTARVTWTPHGWALSTWSPQS